MDDRIERPEFKNYVRHRPVRDRDYAFPHLRMIGRFSDDVVTYVVDLGMRPVLRVYSDGTCTPVPTVAPCVLPLNNEPSQPRQPTGTS